MARAKKAITKEVKIERNPAVFTEDEVFLYRRSLIEELQWKSKGSLSPQEIEQLADSVINKDEETTLLLRKKGILRMSTYLIENLNRQVA
jgi:hypothetical protein